MRVVERKLHFLVRESFVSVIQRKHNESNEEEHSDDASEDQTSNCSM